MNQIDINTLMLLGIALFNCLTALLSLRNHRAIKQVAGDVKDVERATNGMKSALIDATDRASRAEGHAAGLKEGQKENGTKPQ